MKSLCIRISDIPTDKIDKDTVGIQLDILWGRDIVGKSSAIFLSFTTYLSLRPIHDYIPLT